MMIPVESGRARMLEDTVWGLSQPQKQLPSKYFYDTRGSELFEAITELPEYYLTRTERLLLESEVAGWVTRIAPASLVELGAGSALKTRVLLDAMALASSGTAYAPVDVAGEFLRETTRSLLDEFPSFDIRPQVMDITTPLDFAGDLPRPVLFALLGSTLGNFDPTAAVDLLANVRASMREGDLFLLGADLRPGSGKTVKCLERAYNDGRGVTADFNLNILRVLNREIGTDFELSDFRHRAFYRESEGRIEMHLVALHPLDVHVPGGSAVHMAEGESIRTELSCKYDRETIDELLGAAGMKVVRWCQDGPALYSMALASPA